jgi:hypothetical protein
MKQLDKLLIGLIIGGIFPLLLGLCAVIVWFYADKDENNALTYLLVGLAAGFLIDLRFLKKWVRHRYELPIWFVCAIYLFYNVLIYGMFMGFPVFNLFLGLMAGYYSGQRIHFNSILPEVRNRIFNRISLFTALIMTLICISSGFIALAGNGVGKEVQSMLGLDFDVTKGMIAVLAWIGGLFLIVSEYYLTKMTVKITIKLILKSR